MTKLEPGSRGAIRELLEQVPFNVLMAKAVATGRVSGEVWVDRMPEPRSCYVRHKYGMAFLVGRSDDDAFNRWVEERLANADGARGDRDLLQAYPDSWHAAIEPHARTGTVRRWNRTNFRFDADRFHERFPEGGVETEPGIARASDEAAHETVAADQERVERFEGTVIPIRFWDSIADFTKHGVGFFATDRDDPSMPASLAFSSYIDSSRLEIGIETAERFRGRGYAQAACARIIREAIARGLEPVWSCKTENTGSARLAERMGFVALDPHPYYELPVV